MPEQVARDRRAFLRWAAAVGAGGSLALAPSERLVSGRAADLVAAMAAHEQVHVALVTRALDQLGAILAKPPRLQLRRAALAGPDSFLRVASTLEELTVAAYQGQLARLRSPALLALVT